MSLRWKIAAALAVLAGVISTLAAFGAFITTSQQLDRSIDDTLVTRAQAAVSRGAQAIDRRGRPGSDKPPLGAPTVGLTCPAIVQLQSIRTAQILLLDGTTQICLNGGAAIPVTATDRAVSTSGDGVGNGGDGDGEGGNDGSDKVPDYRFRTIDLDGESTRVITMAFPQGGAIMLARGTAERDNVLDGLRDRLILIGATGIVAAAIVGFLLATRIVAPVRRLTRTAEHIAATRDLTTPIPAAGRDEIGSLSTSFTTMVASLASSQEQQQRLISDASHEMRTPLTSLRTNLELLARLESQPLAVLPEGERQAVISDLQFETSELTTLLTELVELATDRTANEEPLEHTEFAGLCEAIAVRARRRTGRDIHLAQLDTATVEVRPHLIERAISNLVDNAIKYSPIGTPIEIEVHGSRVEVRDHGPGIADDDLPRVFDRFFRATSARTQPGSGLGLAIVKQIVESHEGTVFAGNHPGGGAIVGFELATSSAPLPTRADRR